jgi:hypothetical protein
MTSRLPQTHQQQHELTPGDQTMLENATYEANDNVKSMNQKKKEEDDDDFDVFGDDDEEEEAEEVSRADKLARLKKEAEARTAAKEAKQRT